MNKTTLITGANRGLGLGMVKALLKQEWKIIACYREPESAQELLLLEQQFPQIIKTYSLDLKSEQNINEFAKLIVSPIDRVIANAGVFGHCKTLKDINCETMLDVFQVNTVAPLLLAKAFREHLLNAQFKQFIAISSMLGSIGDNASGESYDYRCSKAALNMAMKTLALEFSPDDIHVLAMDPGWVKTRMGGDNAPLSIEESVSGLIKTFDSARNYQSGSFVGYNGEIRVW